MAIRNIREIGDEVLTKKCREVKEMNDRIRELIEDMLDTMYAANGVGLAAPQVGVLKRIVVIDIGEGPVVLINPQIVETSGSQTGGEGCLSVNRAVDGIVPRYARITVEYYDEFGQKHEKRIREEIAVAFQHEIDHLNGILFVDKIDKKDPYKNQDNMRAI